MKKTIVSVLLLALLLLLTGCACKHEQTHLVNAAAATCTAVGYTGDTVCDACEKTVAEGSAIAALGHEPGERTGEAEPTGDTVDVDAITGATVTSKAIVRSVNSAVSYVTGADVSSGATSWGG